jgi:TusA-related sulfurtransferase/uncharacterized OsmC-like protein
VTDESNSSKLPEPDATCDGGDLDCGSGLLLIIRNAMAPLSPGGVLEVRSRETSVKEDLPAWCRMVGHDLLTTTPTVESAGSTSYFIRKKQADAILQQDLQQAQNLVYRARVRARGGMESEVFVRNHSFRTGQPVSFDTADKGVSAVEYLLGALGSCIAVGFQWRASQRSVIVRNVEVSVKTKADNILVYLGVENEGSPGFTAMELSVYVDADADLAVLNDLLQETLLRSPVARTLSGNVAIKAEVKKA